MTVLTQYWQTYRSFLVFVPTFKRIGRMLASTECQHGILGSVFKRDYRGTWMVPLNLTQIKLTFC